jgi:hypothetical protein
MCGGCSRTVLVDPWSGVLSGRRARWEAARVANDVLAASGHRTRVTSNSASFVVRGATGGAVVADTAGQLWRAVLAQPGPPLTLPRDGGGPTPVAEAVLAALRAADPAAFPS